VSTRAHTFAAHDLASENPNAHRNLKKPNMLEMKGQDWSDCPRAFKTYVNLGAYNA